MSNTTEQANVELKVNSQDAIEKFNKLDAKAKELRKNFADAFKKSDTKGIEKIKKELNQTTREMENMQTRVGIINSSMKRLSEATPNELRKTIKNINSLINSGAVRRGSAEWDSYNRKLKLVKKELNDVNKEHQATQGWFSSMAGQFTKWFGAWTMLTQLFDNFQMKFSQMRQHSREKESAQASLKSLTGLDDTSIQWLTKRAETLSTTMDKTKLRVTADVKDILDAYMMVGSNKPELLTDKEALDAVTVETLRLASAAGMSAKDAVDAVTTSLNQYGVSAEEAAKYVNILAAGSKFGASNVQSQATAILKSGTAAASANISMEELVGTIQTLGEKGVKNEIAGTGLKKIFLTLQTGAKDTNPKIVGLTTALSNLKKQVDRAESKTPGGGASFIKKMFGEEGYNVAAILTSNIPKFQEYTRSVTDTSIAVEQAGINSDTASARMAQMKNQLAITGDVLIEKLNPSLGFVTKWGIEFIKIAPAIINFIAQYGRVMVTAGTIIGSYIATKKLQVLWGKLVAIQVEKGIILQNMSTLAQLKNIAADKIAITLLNFKAISQAALNLVTALFTLNLKKAKEALMAMNVVLKLSPWGMAIAAITALVGVIYLLTSRTKGLSEAQKALNQIKEDAAVKSVDEKTKLDLLLSAAKNEKLTLDERYKAIQALNKIIPNYNAQLDKTTGKYIENKMALDQYMKSLAKKYEIEGARSLIADLGKEKAEANSGLAKLKEDAKKLQKEVEKSGVSAQTVGSGPGSAALLFSSPNRHLASVELEIWNREKRISDANKKLKAINETYGVDLQKMAISESKESDKLKCPKCGQFPCQCNSGITDEEQKDIEKKAKEKERIKHEAEVKAKKLLDQELKTEKSNYDINIALNDADVSQGNKTYLKYLDDKYKLDVGYISKQKLAYEKRNLQESDEYKSLIAKEITLNTKHGEDMKNLSLKDLERRQQAEEDAFLSQCYDVNSILYKNERAQNEGLFRINITYLAKKRDLYTRNSKEWHDIQNQIDDAENKEKLRKQKESSEQIAEWRNNYSKIDSVKRMEMELALLDELHVKGLIAEEEYQRFKKGITDKYNNKGSSTEVSDPFVSNIVQISDAIKNLSSDGLNLADILQNIGKGAEAGFAIASAALQQYSQYSQACADLEIAQTEKKYATLIKAAGNNTKKSEQLQQQKEKDIAKIKAKYSAQAEKIEIAQAIAATAMSAIYAYSAALKVGGPFGLALAPIAAGMAIAAGMLQIATIRKQHAAASAAYYTGGFTSINADNHKEAGTVHANEFVANHKAVANPNIRPMLSLIDRAQKNNTIGSITARDVSIALGQVTLFARGNTSTNVEHVATDNDNLILISKVVTQSAQAIKKLNDRLDKGIETFMIMDGERGFDQKYQHYQRLKQNSKR